MENYVTVSAISTVTPAKPILPFLHFLSNLDIAMSSMRFYFQGLYYFRAKSQPPKGDNLIETLKKSLAETLSHFPIAAGRLKLDDAGRLAIDVNSAGIPFIEATSMASLDDWSNLKNAPFSSECNPQDKLIGDQFKDPLVRVQVTRFRCGGIALGLGTSHTVMDGLSAVEFMVAWGQIHRNLQISRQPNMGSLLLKARDPPIVDVSIPEFITRLFPDIHEPELFNYAPPLETPCHRTFTIDASKMEECIKEVWDSEGSAKCSSFEALCGLIWRCITEARGPPFDAITSVNFPINLRGKKRWDPPLPPNFFGNGVQVTVASTTAKDLVNGGTSFGAKKVRNCIQCFEGTGLARSTVDWMELQTLQGRPIGLRGPNKNTFDVTISSVVGLPIYNVDFGWGAVDQFVGPLIGDGQAFLMPSNTGDRSQDVTICLFEADMHRLLQDQVFAYYFK